MACIQYLENIQELDAQTLTHSGIATNDLLDLGPRVEV
jgi:hypothetical protein